jgi:hypothetical protein
MIYEVVFDTVASVAAKLGFHPMVPLGTDDFLRAIVAAYTGTQEGFKDWFVATASAEYRALGERPRWLQDPEWPLLKGHPMTFVGQVDQRFPTNRTSFYIFWDQKQTGATRVVIQVLS